MSSITDLPNEILIQTIGDMPIEEILHNCQINQRFARFCQDPALWQYLMRRDFPWVSIQGVADPRSLYIRNKQARAWFSPKITDSLENRTYWQVLHPERKLRLADASRYVQRNHPNAQGYDRFVYWPDFRVAGTVNDIVRTFQEHGVDFVNVYNLTKGQRAYSPGVYPLNHEVVYNNSFDPLDPDQLWLMSISVKADRVRKWQLSRARAADPVAQLYIVDGQVDRLMEKQRNISRELALAVDPQEQDRLHAEQARVEARLQNRLNKVQELAERVGPEGVRRVMEKKAERQRYLASRNFPLKRR